MLATNLVECEDRVRVLWRKFQEEVNQLRRELHDLRKSLTHVKSRADILYRDCYTDDPPDWERQGKDE